MSEGRKVVIVGGVAAGMSAATRLRRNDEAAQIVVLERGRHVSFANCGLPYHIGGVIADRDDLLLQTPQSLAARFGLDVRVRHEVTSVDPEAQSVSVRDLETGETITLGYDALVLATGASPVVPPIPGAERALVLRDLGDMDAITSALESALQSAPESSRELTDENGQRSEGGIAVVLGGGFVGLEVAENLHARGMAVTVVELADQVLAPLDPEIAELVAARLTERGVTLRTGSAAAAIHPDKVELSDGSLIAADLVVSSVGVRPESGLARAAGLAVGDRGGIVVDREQRTSDPAIFAVGDVAQKQDAQSGEGTLVPLAQTANRHGRLVADAITGRATSRQPVLGTAIVQVFGLVAGSVGWSEKRLRAAGRPVRVIHTHPGSHAGYYPGAEEMALKLLLDAETDQILGAQAVGSDGVDKRLDIIAVAMRAGLTGSDLADLELAYAPQFGSAKDPVNMLGYIADNLVTGATETVQWHQLADEVERGALILDVRTPAEHAAAGIPGAVNIPVDELRQRHTEVPDRRIIVHCAVGLRGHVAVRLLRQHGFDAANLDGGYRTWKAGLRSLSRSATRPGVSAPTGAFRLRHKKSLSE